MKLYNNPAKKNWDAICRRPSSDNREVNEIVDTIISRVKKNGDKALYALAQEIDGLTLSSLQVSEAEFEEAEKAVSDTLKKAIENASSNIKKFHGKQLPSRIETETSPGVQCVQKPVPINRVGIYVPGGTACLFSTVLMLAIPAKIASCPKVIMCTPAGKNGKVSAEVLFAARYCGVDAVYKVGGAQAVAAMAYGTGSIPKVDKIFGPGNQFVTTAKQMVSNENVAIDMPAGPSEVMVIADASASPRVVASDLLSQAEHGSDSQVMLLCSEKEFAEKVEEELERQLKVLPRSQFALKALSKSSMLVFSNEKEMVEFADYYAPEHLIVNTRNPWAIAERITAAGSVFVGEYTPESAGDYASGTNHTLPTSGWARSFSGVNVDSYMRKMTIQCISKEGLENLSDTIVTMAEAEKLQAHANAVKIRINDK
ncbi:MAG: histidinol dehydrogenase [Bacteroidales bacterium]|nr:histidinol dehydrogenase [Bacteroidales bacterium]